VFEQLINPRDVVQVEHLAIMGLIVLDERFDVSD
jgi:hypothetical protein